MHVTTTPLRRLIGLVRTAAGLSLGAGIVTQIVDQIANNAFVASEYFAYFTIQSSIIGAIVLTAGGIWAFGHQRDSRLLATWQAMIVPYAIVTGVVYNLLLRGVSTLDYDPIQWPNELMHVVMPIALIVDWLFAPGRPRLRWLTIWAVVAYPLSWLTMTTIRGLVDGWFPYPFLEPDGPNGVGGVLSYVAGITVAFFVLGTLTILRTRLARQPIDAGRTSTPGPTTGAADGRVEAEAAANAAADTAATAVATP